MQESNSIKTAMLIGATGLTGSLLLKSLLNDSYYSKIIIPVRRSTGINNPKLTEIVTDFDNIKAYAESLTADDVFCCLGTTIKKAGSQEAFSKVDYQYPLDFASTALLNGARQFLIITALGSDINSKFFYNRVKGKVEEDISKLNYKSISIFRPSLILGDRQENRQGEGLWKLLMKIISPFLAGGLKKYRGIEASAIAKAMLITAKEFHKGISIYESDVIQSIAG